MKRTITSYPISDFNKFKTRLLNFGNKFGNFCFLDNHGYDFDKTHECIAGAGAVTSIIANDERGLPELRQFQKINKDWIFGHAAYDLKNKIESLSSKNPDKISFPDFLFFVPEIVFLLSKEKVTISAVTGFDPDEIFKEVNSLKSNLISAKKTTLQSRFSHQEYLETIKKLKEHITRGDCYEICLCQEFFAENAHINPVNVFKKLGAISPNPFSAFYKYEEKYLLCASPERFLKKTNNLILSQPIKGTSKRSIKNPAKDEKNKLSLQLSEKERSENIMIVDLVRNDLSKICIESSVRVKEFLGIYSFPQVHQMISTIIGNLKSDMSLAEILSATFPMGSMTGAPKKRVMELIDEYEKTKRGLFSGTVGYINPEGDFDFNVVIRSILYNKKNNYLSILSGSAITFKSIPQKEYEECHMKMAAMKKALE